MSKPTVDTWDVLPSANTPEQFSWISRNRIDIPAAAVGGLAGVHGAYSGYRDARRRGSGRAAAAASAALRALAQGSLGFVGTQAARRGAGRVVSNLIRPYEYDNPGGSLASLKGLPLREKAHLVYESVRKDVPLDVLRGAEASPTRMARQGLWDAFWDRSPRRAGDLFMQDPTNPQRLRVNLQSQQGAVPQPRKELAFTTDPMPPGSFSPGYTELTGNGTVSVLQDGTAASDDWWDISNHLGAKHESPAVSGNAAARALATLLGRPKMVSVRVPAEG